MTVRERPQINLPPDEIMADIDPDDTSSFACPVCGYEMLRVQVRLIDRLLNVLKPVHRYRCTNLGCGYECNVEN